MISRHYAISSLLFGKRHHFFSESGQKKLSKRNFNSVNCGQQILCISFQKKREYTFCQLWSWFWLRKSGNWGKQQGSLSFSQFDLKRLWESYLIQKILNYKHCVWYSKKKENVPSRQCCKLIYQLKKVPTLGNNDGRYRATQTCLIWKSEQIFQIFYLYLETGSFFSMDDIINKFTLFRCPRQRSGPGIQV